MQRHRGYNFSQDNRISLRRLSYSLFSVLRLAVAPYLQLATPSTLKHSNLPGHSSPRTSNVLCTSTMSNEKGQIQSKADYGPSTSSSPKEPPPQPPSHTTTDQQPNPSSEPHPNPSDRPPTYSALFFKSPPQVTSQPASAFRIAAVMGTPHTPPEPSSSDKRTLKERWKDLRTSLKIDLRDPGYDSRAKPRTMGKWNVDGTEVGRRK